MDSWYVFHVKTGFEEKIKFEINRGLHGAYGIVPTEICIVPRRMMNERKSGLYKTVIRTLFPGYIFIKTNLDAKKYYEITKMPGVIKLLGQPQDDEMDRILTIIGKEDLIGISDILISDGKVKVTSGPLVGQEGKIIKVDRRKGRAKVNLSMLGEPKIVELSVNVLKNLNE